MRRHARPGEGPARSYFEAEQARIRRARQWRTGLVSILVIIALGYFSRELPGIAAYCAGVLICGLTAALIAGEDEE